MYSVCVCLLSVVIIIVMEWWSVEGQDTGSGGSKNGDIRQSGFIVQQQTIFSTPKIERTICLCFKSSDTTAYTGLAFKKSTTTKSIINYISIAHIYYHSLGLAAKGEPLPKW